MQSDSGADQSPVRAADVAAEIRRRKRSIGVLPLHKILYFTQAEHLAWHGTPAFREQIVAWENGPVVASFWREEKYGGSISAEPQAVPATVSDIVTNVLARYGSMSGQQLIDITHREGPWADVTNNGTRVSNQVISHEALQQYGSELPPELREAREHIHAVRDHKPFVADESDALDRFLATHGVE